MSGHSKWAQIKRKKGALDQQRGRLFTKIIREITSAARDGGGSIENNARLRSIVEKAKSVNMPADNIKKAIQRGTGELPGSIYEHISYEGYGPEGVAIYIETLTDNKKRTASDIRRIFSRNGGNLGETGCVSWLFKKCGVISVDKNSVGEDDLITIVLEAGAEDVNNEEGSFDVITTVENFEKVKREVMKNNKIKILSTDITMIPTTLVKLEGKSVKQCISLIESLENLDDVQNVYSNFDASKNALENLEVNTS